MDVRDIIRAVVSADCYYPLAIERLKKKFPDEEINEYQIKELLASDSTANKLLAEQLRGHLLTKMYDNVTQVQDNLMSRIDEMKASDVARLYSSMVTAFATLTAPAVKDTFDFEAEVTKAANMLGVPDDEVRDELKRLRASKAEAARLG